MRHHRRLLNPFPRLSVLAAVALLTGCTALDGRDVNVSTPLWEFQTQAGEIVTTQPIPSVLAYLACREQERQQVSPDGCRCAKLYGVSVPETSSCPAAAGAVQPSAEVWEWVRTECAMAPRPRTKNGVELWWMCPHPPPPSKEQP